MTGAEAPGSSALKFCGGFLPKWGTHEASAERKRQRNRNLMLNLACAQQRFRVEEKINRNVKIMAAAARIRACGL